MKADIHPNWHVKSRIVCATCGTEWEMGSTVENLRVDICANCHPFYTGEQKIVDTEGMVDKFMKRLQVRDDRVAEVEAKVAAEANADFPLEELELGKRYIKIMNEAGINLISDLIDKINNDGDDSILELPGIGVKVLADAKRRISERGWHVNK